MKKKKFGDSSELGEGSGNGNGGRLFDWDELGGCSMLEACDEAPGESGGGGANGCEQDQHPAPLVP